MSGVLSDGRIAHLAGTTPPLIKPFSAERLRPAGYDVAVAKDGLVLPNGDRYPDGAPPFRGSVVLEPGHMAELSSHERFRVPYSVAGNLALKSRFARQGLMLLSGLLIDPGYGLGDPDGGRLRFYVANVGNETITIVPEDDEVVAVQFLTVHGGALAAPRPVDPTKLWSRGRPGFLQDLKSVADVERELSRLRTAFEWVVLLGVFLIAATILSVMLESLLQMTTDDDLVADVKRATPDEASDKWLLGTLFASVAVSLFSLALVFGPRGERHRRRFAVGACFALIYAPAVISLLVYAIDETGYASGFWPVWSLVPFVAFGLGWLLWMLGRWLHDKLGPQH